MESLSRQHNRTQQGCRVSSVSQDRKWTCLKIRGSRTEIKAGRPQILISSPVAKQKINMANVTCFNPQAVMVCLCVFTDTRTTYCERLICNTSEGRDAAHSCTRTERQSNQKGYLLRQTRAEQRKLVLPQRQTAFRQTAPTVITTLPTMESVRSKPRRRRLSAPLFPLRLHFSFFSNSN